MKQFILAAILLLSVGFSAFLSAGKPADGGIKAEEPWESFSQPKTVPEGIEFDEELVLGPNSEVLLNEVRFPTEGDIPKGLISADLEKPEYPSPPTPEKIHPLVVAGIEEVGLGGSLDVVIAFRRHNRIPILPKLVPEVPRAQQPNAAILAERKAILDKVRTERFAELEDFFEAIDALEGAQFHAYYVIGNSVFATVPAWFIANIAGLPEVLAIDPDQTGTPPPDTNPDNDVDDGRDHINTDHFWPYGYTGAGRGYRVGVLDTGVRSTHKLLSNPSHLVWERDCVYGGTQCEDTGHPSYDPDDGFWDHGTKTIAILTGNNSMGDAYRGVTETSVDSFKVYYDDFQRGLSVTAAIKGFSAALEAGDDVIVAEIAHPSLETSSLAQAADDAYDSGAIVVAANGNIGDDPGTVTCPANAHKTLGVGAYNVETGVTFNDQSMGPTVDGRIKPDFQCPTDTETASKSCFDCLGIHPETSGATPYAAGMAMILYDYYKYNGWATNPGKIYAALIAFGDRPYPDFDNETGVGHVSLGNLNCRHWYTGARTVSDGGYVDILFTTTDTGNGDRDLRVALWWPEEPGSHNDIDLRIYDSSMTLRASSLSSQSVFEFATVGGALTPTGTWRARILGTDVPNEPQTVYFLLYRKTWCAP